MGKTLGRGLAMATLSIGLMFAVVDVASAKGGSKGMGGKGFGKAHAMHPGFNKGQKVGWRGAGHPPGWSKGRKVGWGGVRTAPPGWR
jgi:hypothetical protein